MMDVRKGLRGAGMTSLKILSAVIIILLFSYVLVERFADLFQESSISFGDVLGGNWMGFLPLTLMIPLSFLYSQYDPGTRERLILRIVSCCVFAVSVIALTSGLEYTVDSIVLSSDAGIRAVGTAIDIDIAAFRILFLPLPFLEAVHSVLEYRTEDNSR